VRPAEAGKLVNRIVRWAEIPERLPPVARSPDPRDDFLLSLCEAGRVDWLVTGDKRDLLTLGKHGITRIVTAAMFAQELRV
jgi:predicted nucleic acid-binding protein